MPTTRDLTPAQRRAAWVLGLLLALVIVVVGYLLLEPRTPGNAAEGFLGGGLVVLVLAAVQGLRVRLRPDGAGPATRWSAGVPDERDDRILTRSLAVVGLVAVLLTSATALAFLVGAAPEMLFALQPLALMATLGAAFAVISRRS